MSGQYKIRGSFIVHGFVQGVGFRYYVYRNADFLNLSGFAKNLSDGSVQVVAEGKNEDVTALLEKLRQGPSRSSVDYVETDFSEFTNEFNDFGIR